MDRYIIKDVFTNEQRRRLIKDCKSLLLNQEDMRKEIGDDRNYPGLQTPPELYTDPEFRWAHMVMQYRIKKNLGWDIEFLYSWINLSNGNKKDITWHDHEKGGAAYSCVYYMKTFPLFSNGTLFEDGLFKAPQNSLLIFPSNIKHTAPSSPLPFSRYTWAFDLNILNRNGNDG